MRQQLDRILFKSTEESGPARLDFYNDKENPGGVSPPVHTIFLQVFDDSKTNKKLWTVFGAEGAYVPGTFESPALKGVLKDELQTVVKKELIGRYTSFFQKKMGRKGDVVWSVPVDSENLEADMIKAMESIRKVLDPKPKLKASSKFIVDIDDKKCMGWLGRCRNQLQFTHIALKLGGKTIWYKGIALGAETAKARAAAREAGRKDPI